MCAYREPVVVRPEVRAQKYRLNIPTKRKMSVIQRNRKPMVEEAVQLNIIEENGVKRGFSPAPWKSSISSFPDDDLDLDLEDDNYYSDGTSTPATPTSGNTDWVVRLYESACKKHKILPLSCIKTGLPTDFLQCRFTNLQSGDLKCICYALCNAHCVERIEFHENGLGSKVMGILGKVIEQSTFLTHIKLSNNELKSKGAKIICDAVGKNKMIVSLDLSGNGFVESDGDYFQGLIENASKLQELNLSHNELMDYGVRKIAKAIEDSATLRVLDLSWNHIRMKGANAIGEALEKNNSLKRINLAWNGLNQAGAESLALALQKNDTLVELDLTSNRLSEYCIAEILRGLDNNTTLTTLRLGQNQITTRGALSILEHMKDNRQSGIRLLDFGNQEVYDKFENLYKEIQKERDFTVVYGVVWSTERTPLSKAGADEDEVALLSCNPLTVLMESMRLQNLRLVDFFKSLDTNNNKFICINELCDGMLRMGIPIRRQTLTRLLYMLDKDNNNLLDFAEMIEAKNLHRQNLLKILAQENVEFDETEIGKVSLILRRIMGKNFIMKSIDNDTRINDKKVIPTTPSPFQLEEVEASMSNLSVSSNLSNFIDNTSRPSKRSSNSSTETGSKSRPSSAFASQRHGSKSIPTSVIANRSTGK